MVPKTHTTDSHAISLTQEEVNDLNKQYYISLSARKDIILTQTVLNGVVCIRFAVGAARTTTEHIDKALKILDDEADTVFAVWNFERAVRAKEVN